MIVQSSWKVSDDRPITDAVVSSENADLEDEMMVENCVMLEAPEKCDGIYPTIPACQLLISCQAPYQITRISVLSEARVLEIYGHHGEYLKTVKCTLLEEAEDMVVFRGDIDLNVNISLCSIKFVMLRSLSEMWLYGVQVQTVKAAFDSESQMTMPMAAVEQRLSQMGLTLSDKAEAFKQLVQNCQKSCNLDQGLDNIMSNLLLHNFIKSKSPSLDNSVQLLKASTFIENLDSEKNTKNEFMEKVTDIESFANKEPNTSCVSTSPVRFESTASTQTDEEYSSLEENLKLYITQQVEDLDKKLWEKIDMKFKETEAKILCKLEEIESFVKPQGVQTN